MSGIWDTVDIGRNKWFRSSTAQLSGVTRSHLEVISSKLSGWYHKFWEFDGNGNRERKKSSIIGNTGWSR